MSGSPAFQFYPSDFLSDENVQLMSLEQIGAYIILICFAWKEESIPDDIEKLSRLCKTSPKLMKKLWDGIKPCFKIDKKNSKRLIHPRLEEERKKQKDRSKKMKDAAKTRWGKGKPGDANALQEQSKSNALQSSSSTSSSSSKKEHTPRECEFSNFAVKGKEYLAKQNNPNLTNLNWVSGLLDEQLKNLQQERGDLNEKQFLECWQETCDVAVSKGASSPAFYKKVFIDKVRNYHADKASGGSSKKPSVSRVEKVLASDSAQYKLDNRIFKGSDLEYLKPKKSGELDYFRVKDTGELLEARFVHTYEPS